MYAIIIIMEWLLNAIKLIIGLAGEVRCRLPAASLPTPNHTASNYMKSNVFSSLQGGFLRGKSRFLPDSRENRALFRAVECRLVRSTISRGGLHGRFICARSRHHR